jgi:hypothetical protein
MCYLEAATNVEGVVLHVIRTELLALLLRIAAENGT